MEEKLFFFEDVGIKLWAINWQIVLLDGEGKKVELTDDYLESGENSYQKKTFLEDGLALEMNLKIEKGEGNSLFFGGSLVNIGHQEAILQKITPLYFRGFEASLDNIVFFREGWQSWSAAGSFRHNESDKVPRTSFGRLAAVDPDKTNPSRPGQFTSDMYALLREKKQDKALLLGALKSERFFTSIYFRRGSWGRGKPALELTLDADGIGLKPGEKIEFEPQVLLWGDPEAIHKRYLDMAGGKNGGPQK